MIAIAALLVPPTATVGATPIRSDGAVRAYRSPRGSVENPAFSPDGQRLLFTLYHRGFDQGSAGLHVTPLSGGAAAAVLDETGHVSVDLPGGCWNPATNRIAFASDRSGTDEIWTIAADGSGLSRVTMHSDATQFRAPSYSPDGQWIAFEIDTPVGSETQGSIWKVQADGSGMIQLTDGPGNGTDDRAPNWSPQGDRIVFQRAAAASAVWNIFTMAVDGSSVQPVTSGGADVDPSWSPDGQSIVYSSTQGGLAKPAIWSVPSGGGTPVRVTRDVASADRAPSWSPDGTSIVFESHHTDHARATLWMIVAPTPPPPPTACPQCWVPGLVTSWQLQLNGTVDTSVDAAMYDVDMFDTDASVVAALHAAGRKVVCYIDAGTWENWRPDAAQFPAAIIGRPDYPFAGERWLDIRQLGILAPLMKARLDQCQSKGFDGADFDNVDGYANRTGFPLTYSEQLQYDVFLANAAHARNLSVSLKNDLDQVGDLLPYFDWALDEQCFQYAECDALLPFVGAGKAVMEVEYNLAPSQFCPQANALNFNSLKKHLALDAYRVPCR